MQVQMTGIAWYHESDYDFLRSRFKDKNTLPVTYSEWLSTANKLLKELESEKIRVVKVFLTPDTFLPWCKKEKLRLDSKARVKYANLGAMAEWENLTSSST